MSYRNHPGIWFTLYAIVTTFLLRLLFATLNIAVILENSIMCFWTAMMFFGVVCYHRLWIERKLNDHKRS